MKTLKQIKLTPLQHHNIQSARRDVDAVLHDLKGHELVGRALEDMKLLEQVSQILEVFPLGK